MNECQMLHETVLRDIVDAIEYGKSVKDFAKDSTSNLGAGLKGRRGYVGSIAKRTSNLILVFPVLVSSSLSIQTANLISKAIERKCVALLQILFSAINLTESKDLFGYINQVHSNLGTSVDLDSFIDILDNIVTYKEESAGEEIDRDTYEAIKEDLRNINFYLDETFNEVSLNEYTSKYNMYTGKTSIILTEAKEGWHSGSPAPAPVNTGGTVDDLKTRNTLLHGLSNDLKNQNKRLDSIDSRISKIDAKKDSSASKDFAKERMEYFRHQLLPQDVQKSNELMPTMMAVDFTSYDEKSGFKHTQTGIIGVKAKMYPVDGMEIVSRLSEKYSDSNSLFKLIKASTREISFFRDFVFAVDKAKLDAIEVARDSGSSRVFKLLERRAAKNRVSALLKKNDASPITSLVLSQQEVEYLKKYKHIDIENRQVAKSILSSFNLMDIAIVDETIEVARFMYDDDTNNFEVLSFGSLEKEAKDNSYKKVLNLLSKVR